jgi:putative flippase GtrA
MKPPRFVLFLAAGGIAAAANFGSRFAFDLLMPYVPAIVLAYCVGMATAFTLNRAFVFTGAANPVRQQATWFVLVNLAAVAQTVLISLLFARWVFPATGMDWHPEAVAHAIGVVVPVFTSYIGHKTLTFRAQ